MCLLLTRRIRRTRRSRRIRRTRRTRYTRYTRRNRRTRRMVASAGIANRKASWDSQMHCSYRSGHCLSMP